MIPKETVDKIIDAARVEDVLGEFITLKKRGVNLLGLCPFHGEKSPSFTVSPVKGIYKCFGCGKAGNSVNFIMDHLQLSYPEALKWLAKKYGIEVVEKEITPEEKEKQSERESMFLVMQYAAGYYKDVMLNSDEGKSIGLGYFLERGLRADIIEKFQLGYSLENRRAFTETAAKNGYQPKYLAKTGMSVVSNKHPEGAEITENVLFDRWTSRVMFPIHDDGGRVVGFGGRILTNDKNVAKYINSPETDIYNKSKILYGLWLGKKAIQKNDVCYLVEGYMDVIAMHQAGIENVVASSGTSLTTDHVKALHRFTKNIVVLFDGDAAGQKASNRAIPMLLEEGMNVRLLTFPNDDDPDSYSRKVSAEEFKTYLENNTQDFLIYKAQKLSNESKNDPIKKASVIKDIVENIAIIPDAIIRGVYVKECAGIMQLEERILQNEINKIRRDSDLKKNKEKEREKNKPSANLSPEDPAYIPPEFQDAALLEEEPKQEHYLRSDSNEKELLRILLEFGNVLINIEAEDLDENSHEVEIDAADYIVFELLRDNLSFSNPIHQLFLDEYINKLSESTFPEISYFSNHPNPAISSFVINYYFRHEDYKKYYSKHWQGKFSIYVTDEVLLLKKSIQRVLFSYKESKLQQIITEKLELLKTIDQDEQIMLVTKDLALLNEHKRRVNRLLGIIITK